MRKDKNDYVATDCYDRWLIRLHGNQKSIAFDMNISQNIRTIIFRSWNAKWWYEVIHKVILSCIYRVYRAFQFLLSKLKQFLKHTCMWRDSCTKKTETVINVSRCLRERRSREGANSAARMLTILILPILSSELRIRLFFAREQTEKTQKATTKTPSSRVLF